MKKQLAILLFGCTTCGTAFGAIFDWWNQRTICQVNTTPCYGGLTAGIDSSAENGWDVSGNCRGKKIICADALTNSDEATPKERYEILHNDNISTDFDTDVYVSAQNCYGARKTRQNGTMVLMNGEYAKVWCNDVLGALGSDGTDVTNGVIITGEEPSCQDLADAHYAAILNGNCYGKYYDDAKYAIECDGDTPTIIVRNGALYTSGVSGSMTTSMASTRFTAMQASAAAQRAIHFPK